MTSLIAQLVQNSRHVRRHQDTHLMAKIALTRGWPCCLMSATGEAWPRFQLPDLVKDLHAQTRVRALLTMLLSKLGYGWAIPSLTKTMKNALKNITDAQPTWISWSHKTCLLEFGSLGSSVANLGRILRPPGCRGLPMNGGSQRR